MPDAAATDASRDQIAVAALELFAERGYAATGIADIRARSGASTGSIYHHFGSKEQIAAALYAEGLAGYQEGLLRRLRRLRRSASAEAGVRAMVRHHLRWVRGNRSMATFLLAGRDAEVRLAGQARVTELNRRTFGEMAAWHRDHVEAGTLRDVPLDVLYAVAIGPAQEFCRHWLAGATKTPIDRAERELADSAWAALRV